MTLHSAEKLIEGSLQCKEFVLAIFLDIEGAFNNVLPGAILSALIGVELCLINFISRMLSTIIIIVAWGGALAWIYVSKGTLLWAMIVNEKLQEGAVK